MKTCKNCGARYEETLLVCPYCGAEDKKLSKRQYREKINGLRRQRQNIKRLPQILPRKALKVLGIGILAAVAVFVLSVLILLLVQIIKKPRTIRSEEENIACLEAYLQNGQFQELYDFYQELPYTYGRYDKYQEVAMIYKEYQRLQDNLESYREALEWESAELVLQSREFLLERLNRIRGEVAEKVDDKSRLGNESFLQQIYEMGLDEVCDVLSLSREEVEALLADSV